MVSGFLRVLGGFRVLRLQGLKGSGAKGLGLGLGLFRIQILVSLPKTEVCRSFFRAPSTS